MYVCSVHLDRFAKAANDCILAYKNVKTASKPVEIEHYSAIHPKVTPPGP